MDVGAVGGWSWQDDTGGGYDQGDGIYAFAFKGKGKSKGNGKGECYNCGASGHYSRESPNPQKGKSKGKGFQGECYNCKEKGHPARECPKGKDGGKSKKGKEKVTKAKAKEPGVGERVFGQLTEKRQEIGSGSSRKKRSRQGALRQLGETRKESTSMRRGMRRSEGRGKELWGSTCRRSSPWSPKSREIVVKRSSQRTNSAEAGV